MAHLSGPDGRGRTDRDRGQLLLVAVLVLAASFIVLALVINSAIFTENLATREDVAGSEETLEYRAEVLDGVGETLSNGNEDKDLSTHSGLEDHVETEVATLRTLGGLSQAIRGGLVDLTYQSKTNGDRIAQEDSSRALTDRNDTGDWTLIDNANSVRNVQFNLTASDTTGDSFIFPSNDPFRLLVEGSSWTWTMSVANDTVFFGTIDTDEIVIRVERPDGTVAECVRDEPENDDSLRIDVTGGTAGGERCHALDRRNGREPMWLGTGVSTPYDISFENGDKINGSYSMITEGGTPNSASLESGHDADEPFVMDALYDVELSYVYQSHAVAYEDRIQVAPGETPPTPPPSAFYPEPNKDCEWVAQETDNGTDTIKIDNQVVDCDVSTEEVVEMLNSAVVLGDVKSQNKTLDMDDSEIYGNATTQRVADIQNGTVTGDLTSTNKNVKIADDTAVRGAVTGGEQVEIKGGSVIEGNIESETKEVKILDGSTVEESVTADDFVKLEDVTVEGHVYINESDFDCTNSVINGQDCSSYTPKDPGDWPP